MTTPIRPWNKLGVVHSQDERIFHLDRLKVADPRNGSEYQRVVLRVPDWVNVIAVTADEQVVLVRQFRFGVWAETLEIPGGMVDPGESAEAAASRELEEETGFQPARLRLLGVSRPNPAIQDNRIHAFLATGCRRLHAGAPEATEDLRVELVPRTSVADLVRQGAINHSLVLAALYFETLAPASSG